MPTPKIYESHASIVGVWIQRNRWVFLVSIVAIVLAALALDRFVPSLGAIPGRVLFVILVAYFAALAPLLLFAKPLAEQPWSKGYAFWAWVRALICSSWIAFGIWAVLLTLTR